MNSTHGHGSATERPDTVGFRLRRLAAAFVALLGTRAELASTEFDEFRERQRAIVSAGAAAAVCFAFALVMASLLVVVAFWDTHRIGAIVALLIVYVAAGGALAFRAHRLRAASPKLFAATIEELRKDADQLLH